MARCRGTLALSLCCFLAACDSATTTVGLKYPPARTVPVVDDYHGTKVADPYRWLEDVNSKEVRDWASAQNALFESVVRNDVARARLAARMEELAKPWDVFDALDPAEPPLIDGKSVGAGREVDEAWRSPDRKHVVYTVSAQGDEWVDLHIRRIADGADLNEPFDALLWTDAIWTRDSQGFFYVRQQRPDSRERTLTTDPAVFYHRLGTPQAKDVAVFTTPAGTTDITVTIQSGGDGRYLFISEGNGAHVESIGWLLSRMHVLDLGNAVRPALATPLIALSDSRDAAYRVVGMDSGIVYLFTDRQAPRRRLVAVDLQRPAPEHWRNVIVESADLIDSVQRIGQRWLVSYVHNVQHALRAFSLDGRLEREIATPPMRSLKVQPGRNNDEVLIDSMGWTTSPERTRFNLTTGAAMVEHRGTTLDFDVEQVWYPSKDDVRIPMSVIHRRGLVKDGSHPVLLDGYGASSQLTLPQFAENLLAAVDLGFVVGIPALRGGGEFGRDWYEAATLGRKQTTFNDFIAAAEYLVAERYTSVGQVAIRGASNGGQLVTAVLTQRPDLFRVAVAEVPMTDAIRYDRGRHLTQFGSPADPEQFQFLFAYSPQHRIRPRTCYPSTMITTSFNDARAPAWMPLKFTAALQAAQSCGNPIVLRADTGGGHFGDPLQNAADALTFIARELGIGRR